MKKYSAKIIVVLFLVLQTCSIYASASELPIGESFYYFRCGSTSWGADANSRMTEGANLGVLELTYEVNSNWMMGSGDDCVFTETSEKDGWGSWHKRYGIYFHNYIVRAPSSHTVQEAEPNKAHFKVSYPQVGRYKAIFNTYDKTLSIISAGDPKPGGVAWTAVGGLIVDPMDSDAGFFITQGSERKLKRIDLNTGYTLWQASGDIQIYPNFACGTESTIIGVSNSVADKYLIAIDKASGETLWKQDMDGQLDDTYASLSCRSGFDYVVLRWGTENKHALINKVDGSARWIKTFEDNAYVYHWFNGSFILRVRDYANDTETIRAVSVSNGDTLWEQTASSYRSTYAYKGGLYVMTQEGVFSRFNANTGVALWSADYDQERSWPIFSDDAIYVQNWSQNVARVDPDSGHTIWSNDLTQYDAESIGIVVTQANEIYLLSQDYENSTTEVLFLNKSSGEVLWRYSPENSYARLESLDGDFYLVDRGTLRHLDKDGVQVWSTLVENTQSSTMFGGSIRGIRDSSVDTLYLSYSGPGYKYAPGGIIALDRANGDIRWDYYNRTLLHFVSSNDWLLFLIEGFGSQTIAIVK